ncbi:sulfurtransferase [Corallococcus sp. M34]|uniref:sulfurtransferase n=1 Tax=Citreicoccus inhibens TaxID=2849499 RepID=UPI001C2159ED|nr:sulfurtransferase [Citreicoccus inhibens]MBU8899578.1 sulfurtransferase [Citreicoccus inhibens]
MSVSWLAEHLGHPQLVVLDASLKPATASAGASTGNALHVPGTRLFDFDKRICDQTTSLPHMMPSPELFEREVRALGIRRDSRIVIYDRVGVYASPRAWWMFKAMGHEHVAVLDGGLPAWVEAKHPCAPVGSATPVEPGDFSAAPRPGLFCDAEQVAAALSDNGYAVLDARSEGRFLGREPEPRAGLRPGHMPRALNLPFNAVLANGRMRDAEELAVLFDAKAAPQRKLIFSCGSGVTACILALAAVQAGRRELAVYDGSWSEWGLPSSRPVVTG